MSVFIKPSFSVLSVIPNCALCCRIVITYIFACYKISDPVSHILTGLCTVMAFTT